jgi:peptidoglycan hydrolase-like protein with peptidoglycan-binding domain
MKLPDDFFKPDRKHKLAQKGYQLNDESKVRFNLEQCKMRELLDVCLEETVHWRHASMESNAGTSIENPHNMAHMSLGFPVSNLGFASFHPIFYMLHANVDRYYEQYLRLEPDSKKEFETHQAQRMEKGGKDNHFLKQLIPFENPLKKKEASTDSEAKAKDEIVFCPHDLLVETDKNRYTYDKLPVRRPPQMREPPLFAVFEKFDPVHGMIDKEGNMKDLLLHIFLFDKNQFPEPEIQAALIPVDAELNCESNVPGQLVYAGWTAAIASKGPKCSNCATTDPVTLVHNVTEAAAELGVARGAIGIKVMCLDDEGKVCTAEHVQEVHGEKVILPVPKLLGPMFDANAVDDTQLCKDSATKKEEDQVERVKLFLHRLGFYKGELDGVFSEELAEALKRYQRFTGIADDGKLGAVTKHTMLAVRNDTHSDVYDGSDGDASPKESPTFDKGKTIKWWMGTCPGYLDASKVLEEATTATGTWATALNGSITFERVDVRDEADITIAWEDNQKGQPLTFDGKGGAIAHATDKGVALDSNERWRLSGTTRKRADEYAILPVLLHELGHSLGLQAHSRDPISVMAPYYMDNRVQLSEADVTRAKAMYD